MANQRKRKPKAKPDTSKLRKQRSRKRQTDEEKEAVTVKHKKIRDSQTGEEKEAEKKKIQLKGRRIELVKQTMKKKI